jgi:hypothetical protein
MLVVAINRPEITPLKMPERFFTEVVYFTTPPGERGAPATMAAREYFVRLEDAKRWLDELVVRIVSPLDSSSRAEIGLTDYHETWLEWMVGNQIEHIRLE